MNNKLIIQELQNEANTYKNDKSKIFKFKALTKAIHSIQNCNYNITSGQFASQNCDFIGKGISQRIDNILQQSSSFIHNQDDDGSLNNITGVGQSRIQTWNKLGIFNINQLKKAIKNNNIKITHHIQIGIKYYDDFLIKIPHNSIQKFYNIFSKLINQLDNNLIFDFCGSFRRKCKTSGDIDILISHKHNKNFLSSIVDLLTQQNLLIDHLTSTKGGKKYMGVLMLDFPCRIDIRFVEYDEYYTSLLYFTGSRDFNIQMRKKALSLGYTLNEYHLKNNNDNNIFTIHSEKDIFDYLNMTYVEPFDRNI